MKKILLLVTLLILVIGCSSVTNEVSDPNKIYRLSDFSEIGWKQKKPFVTDFPQSDKAFWGYFKGHEVGLILYPSSKLANEYGIPAADNQIEVIDGKKTINVERFVCRGNTGSIESPSCPNPMPMYSEYVVKNNVVILCEIVKSLMKGSKIKADSTSFCEDFAKNLESNQK